MKGEGWHCYIENNEADVWIKLHDKPVPALQGPVHEVQSSPIWISSVPAETPLTFFVSIYGNFTIFLQISANKNTRFYDGVGGVCVRLVVAKGSDEIWWELEFCFWSIYTGPRKDS